MGVEDFVAVFVVAGGGEGGDGTVDPAGGVVPFAPLFVFVGGVDEVSGVEEEAGFGGVGEARADDAGPEGVDIVLSVAEVDEFEGRGAGGGGAELVPVRPVEAIADAVDVGGVGHEPGEGGGVVVGEVEVGLEGFGLSGEGGGGFDEGGAVFGGGELDDGFGDRGGGTPGDGGGGGGVGGPGEDDAVGVGGGAVEIGGGDLRVWLAGEAVGGYQGEDGERDGEEAAHSFVSLAGASFDAMTSIRGAACRGGRCGPCRHSRGRLSGRRLARLWRPVVRGGQDLTG